MNVIKCYHALKDADRKLVDLFQKANKMESLTVHITEELNQAILNSSNARIKLDSAIIIYCLTLMLICGCIAFLFWLFAL